MESVFGDDAPHINVNAPANASELRAKARKLYEDHPLIELRNLWWTGNHFTNSICEVVFYSRWRDQHNQLRFQTVLVHNSFLDSDIQLLALEGQAKHALFALVMQEQGRAWIKKHNEVMGRKP